MKKILVSIIVLASISEALNIGILDEKFVKDAIEEIGPEVLEYIDKISGPGVNLE